MKSDDGKPLRFNTLVSFHEFFDRVVKSEITDAVTIAAIMKARLVIGE